MGSLKTKWQESWTPKNLTGKLIKLWNSIREKGVDIYQHWLTVGENFARCNLDQLNSQKIEDELQLPIYLDTVKDTELTKQVWEKSDSRSNMEKFIKASVEAEREYEKLFEKSNRIPKR